MTSHVPMARVPFASLDNPRLQHLASAKNRQNGMIAQKPVLSGKANITPTKSAYKRPFELSTFDDYDSENLDPAQASKKSKGKTDVFTLSTTSSSMPPPPSRLSTPLRANMSTPRTPMTAPAGRSPKRKIAGISKKRHSSSSASFTRIDPPFASRGSSLPFSLDAALSGTFSTPIAKPSPATTIQESMPKNWFFEIYEDTPEEEAANLMEHSTLTLDLSSDDEGSSKTRDDRGKENIAPEGYEAGVAPRASVSAVSVAAETVRHVKRDEIVRKKILKDEMDDGDRSPLSDLETDPFFPEGLNKNSYVLVDLPTPEKSAPAKLDIASLFAAPGKSTIESSQKSSSPSSFVDMPIVDTTGNFKGEIVVWEDSSSNDSSLVVSEHAVEERKVMSAKAEVELRDENTAPAIDENEAL
ncbi:hypothetical protein LTR17_008209 [Elasticomyces elasticus]|nr:hypothetical protein LTR17_008209 [Elasticomyces elasticus]